MHNKFIHAANFSDDFLNPIIIRKTAISEIAESILSEIIESKFSEFPVIMKTLVLDLSMTACQYYLYYHQTYWTCEDDEYCDLSDNNLLTKSLSQECFENTIEQKQECDTIGTDNHKDSALNVRICYLIFPDDNHFYNSSRNFVMQHGACFRSVKKTSFLPPPATTTTTTTTTGAASFSSSSSRRLFRAFSLVRTSSSSTSSSPPPSSLPSVLRLLAKSCVISLLLNLLTHQLLPTVFHLIEQSVLSQQVTW